MSLLALNFKWLWITYATSFQPRPGPCFKAENRPYLCLYPGPPPLSPVVRDTLADHWQWQVKYRVRNRPPVMLPPSSGSSSWILAPHRGRGEDSREKWKEAIKELKINMEECVDVSLTEYKQADWIRHQPVNTRFASSVRLLYQIGKTSGWVN